MNCLAGLADLRRHLDLPLNETNDNPRLYAALQTASHAIETICARHFVPRLQTVIQHLPRAASEITLNGDLLQLIAIADDGGSIAPEMVELYPLDSSVSILRRTDGSVFTGTLTIEGWWGWHDSPQELWVSANDTVRSDPLEFDAYQLEVLSVDDEDVLGRAPRFQVGQLIRIGNELIGITRTDSDANLLTLERGANGTQAVTHLLGAQISIYQPPPVLHDLALRYAAWLAQHAEPPSATWIASLEPFRRIYVK